ncbi:ribosome biogenesis GTP-binding protein YihA/YsxC [Salinivirga cyanobacteriivorans]
MEIKQSQFIVSNEDYRKCPEHDKPEYAFIGRSNVGKSSLINMLTNRKSLAKISENPGKTMLINHFLINDQWYLVDLPGYGFAKRSKKLRARLRKIINNYILNREELTLLFILIDVRHKPIKSDLDFIQWAGEQGIPVALIFTKADKTRKHELNLNIELYKQELKKNWEELPKIFITSALKKQGRDEVLAYIEQVNKEI